MAEGNRKQNDEIIELLKLQNERSQKMDSYLQAKIPDMGKYFPLKDIETLNNFLDDSDGLYALRRAEFYNYLMCTPPEANQKKNLFGTAIIKTLFSNEFLRITTWPANNARNPRSKDHLIPQEFVALLKCSLSRLCGAGIIDHSFVNLHFWNNWPKKYREAKRYAKSLVGEVDDDDDDEDEFDGGEEEEPEQHKLRKKKFTKKAPKSKKPAPSAKPPTTASVVTVTPAAKPPSLNGSVAAKPPSSNGSAAKPPSSNTSAKTPRSNVSAKHPPTPAAVTSGASAAVQPHSSTSSVGKAASGVSESNVSANSAAAVSKKRVRSIADYYLPTPKRSKTEGKRAKTDRPQEEEEEEDDDGEEEEEEEEDDDDQRRHQDDRLDSPLSQSILSREVSTPTPGEEKRRKNHFYSALRVRGFDPEKMKLSLR